MVQGERTGIDLFVINLFLVYMVNAKDDTYLLVSHGLGESIEV